MREHHVGSVVVTQTADGQARAVGILTDRDLVVDSMARGADAAREPLSSLIEGRVLHRVAGDADLGTVIHAHARVAPGGAPVRPKIAAGRGCGAGACRAQA